MNSPTPHLVSRFGGRLAVGLVLATIGLMACPVVQWHRNTAELRLLRERLDGVQVSIHTLFDQERQHQRFESAVGRVANTPWTLSKDQKVRARLAANSDVTNPGVPVLLMVEIQNATNARMTLDHPSFAPWDVKLQHNGRPAPYTGPVPDPAPPRPIQLEPGGIVRDTLVLEPCNFPALSSPGDFSAAFQYQSTNYNAGAWTGTVGPLTVHWISR